MQDFPSFFRASAARRTRGQTLVEYTLILAVLTVLAIAVFGALGQKVIYVFSQISSILDTAQSS